MIKPPCKKCKDKSAGCQQFCLDYRDYLLKLAEQKKGDGHGAVQTDRR